MLPAACLSALLCPLLVWPFAAPLDVRTHDLLKLFPFGTTQFGLGLVFLTVGGQMVSATENALINTLETPLAVAWVWVCFARHHRQLHGRHDPHGGSRWARLAQQSVKVRRAASGQFASDRARPRRRHLSGTGRFSACGEAGGVAAFASGVVVSWATGKIGRDLQGASWNSTVKRRSVSPRKPRRLAVTHVKVKFG